MTITSQNVGKTALSDPVVLPVLSAGNFVIGMGAFAVIGFLEPIAEGLALSTATAGWVMTTYAIAYAILSPLLVAATGQIGRRRILTLGLALFALGAAVAAVAQTPSVLFAGRAIAAAGAGLFSPLAAAVAAALSPPGQRARALSAVFFGLTLAQVLGVPLGSYIAYSLGWRFSFALVAFLSVPVIWLVWARVPRGLRFQPVGFADLRHTLTDPLAMLAVGFTATFLGAIYVVFTFLTPLLSTGPGFGAGGIAIALLVAGFGAVVGNLLGGRAADRFGPYRTLLALSISQAAVLPLFSILPDSTLPVLLLIFVWTSLGWSFVAGQQTRLIAIAPERASVMLSLNAAGIYVGAALGSAIGAGVLSAFGLGALGIAGGLAALVAIANLILSERLNK